MNQHFNITIQGRVQGVYYRASAQQKALELGLVGWVCNQSDGSVYMEAEGSKEQLNALVAWCKKGPPAARVNEVSYTIGDCKNFEGFKITR
ncbi:MAG: acylphosphatase [Cyclobacteriaceae bacterium]